MKIALVIFSLLALAAAKPGGPPTTAATTCSDTYTFSDITADLEEAGQVTTAEELCGTAARSFYKEILSDDGVTRTIISSGVPDHTHDAPGDDSLRCEDWGYYELPASPEKSDTYTKWGAGAVGQAISGAFIFNNEDINENVAALVEADSIDDCNGHYNDKYVYHYHMAPVCDSDDLPYDNDCPLMGYMSDGFPVYGFGCGTDGANLTSCYTLTGDDEQDTADWTYASSDTCDLDKANGYTFTDGKGYAYVFSESYPWVFPGRYSSAKYSRCTLSGVTSR